MNERVTPAMDAPTKIKIITTCGSVAGLMVALKGKVTPEQYSRLDLAAESFVRVLEEINPEMPKLERVGEVA